MRIGFVGTGAITEAMVTGILSGTPLASEVVVSPRNAEIAARLARMFPAVRIAGDNQEIVDASDILVLAIRPQIAEEVVKGLRFVAGQTVISVIAATDRDRLKEWVGQEVDLTQAIPLPFVASHEGVTAIYPPNSKVASLFSSLGTAVQCGTREEYDLLAVASALMATYFGIMGRTTSWLAAKGLPEDSARDYLAALFAGLSQTVLRSNGIPLNELSAEFATKGGLNEQVLVDFEGRGGIAALTEALEGVLRRIRG
ncbi:pyrroline-5-carboxylate reductase [Pararhizobium sp. BT-229]|uniref:pyrroline-5-carboxylate reductase n=1 Tax=Pararhizobium sp. BT-229 TaxID=2986923 RepID=UPI0021F72534|nr:pyrroline-5-carboxylate reductase [Pararhizobium sp. BT-229]MCV9967627.1 pyrroline-5-carboxylate reductase [Pararhizobium sp. BT-229]